MNEIIDNEIQNLEPISRTGKQISNTKIEACPKVYQEGFQFFPSVIREELGAKDIDGCAVKCKQASYCRSFAFRYA